MDELYQGSETSGEVEPRYWHSSLFVTENFETHIPQSVAYVLSAFRQNRNKK